MQVNANFGLAFGVATLLYWLWSSSNLYTSWHKFVAIWPPNASWLTLIASQLYTVCVKFTTFCDWHKLGSWLVNPFGHPLQSVCKFWFCKLASGLNHIIWLVFYFYEQCNIGVLSSVHACNLPDLTHYLWDFKGAVETWQYICISGCWPGQIWQNNIKGVTTGFDE